MSVVKCTIVAIMLMLFDLTSSFLILPRSNEDGVVNRMLHSTHKDPTLFGSMNQEKRNYDKRIYIPEHRYNQEQTRQKYKTLRALTKEIIKFLQQMNGSPIRFLSNRVRVKAIGRPTIPVQFVSTGSNFLSFKRF